MNQRFVFYVRYIFSVSCTYLRSSEGEMSIFDGFVQAEAIRKILGQDSSRKKREDKLKKRREELEQVL